MAVYVEMSNLSVNTMGISEYSNRYYIGGSKFQNCDTLLARITPCLENGKTAFVDILENGEIAAGSTEFIVLRARKKVSPYWVYCLARDENFRTYAIRSMVGSSGRQRVHDKYLYEYLLPTIDNEKMKVFSLKVRSIFELAKLKRFENQKLEITKELLLSEMAK